MEFPKFVSWLERLEACPEGVKWARQCASVPEAADRCPHAEWLLWTVGEAGFVDETVGRRFALAAVRRQADLLVDPRQQQALAILESASQRGGPPQELLYAADLVRQAQTALSVSDQWSMAVAAAGAALWHTAADGGWEAAREVHRHCLRAVAWNPWGAATTDDEDRVLAAELRRLLRPFDERILEFINQHLTSSPEKPGLY
jgi:hypothetical protein